MDKLLSPRRDCRSTLASVSWADAQGYTLSPLRGCLCRHAPVRAARARLELRAEENTP
jgi:hypothetical protein